MTPVTKGTNYMESRIAQSPPDAAHTTEKLVGELKRLAREAEQKAVERAKAADRMVREHPYPSIGLAFAVGLIAGFLACRKW